MKKLPLLICLFLVKFTVFSQQPYPYQQLSPQATISLITIDRADEELFQSFGHSEVFVYDPINGFDKVYSWGSFDFNTEGFYWKFIRGLLPYQLTISNISTTLLAYGPQYENRSIVQQTLNLSQAQKQRVYELMEENYLPQNRTYAYKFFQDNCSTRIRDVFKKGMGDSLTFIEKGIEIGTYRSLMNGKLPNTPWAKFGMNLAIGNPSDKALSYAQTMYLPDNLFKAFAHAKAVGKPFANETKTLFTAQKSDIASINVFSPNNIFSSIGIIALLLTIYQYLRKSKNRVFDKILLFSIGLVGVLLTFLWFFTSHGVTMYNWNLVWAWPTHLITAFLISSKKHTRYLNYYFIFYLVAVILAFILGNFFGYFKNEIFPTPIYILFLIIAVRVSFYLKNK